MPRVLSAIDKRVVAVVALSLILTVAAMFRDQLVLNTGSSVPVGVYIAADPADAEYVTFCLPPLPHGVRFDPALCSPVNPNGRPVIKRVTGVMDGALHVRGDIPSALDSDLFGAPRFNPGSGMVAPCIRIRQLTVPNWRKQPCCSTAVPLIALPSAA